MTRFPLFSAVDGSQGRSGRVRKISTLPGFDPPIPVARSESLSRSTSNIDVTAHTATVIVTEIMAVLLVALSLVWFLQVFSVHMQLSACVFKCYVSSVATTDEYIFIRF